jgi:outer membrane protein assembly factor BamA
VTGQGRRGRSSLRPVPTLAALILSAGVAAAQSGLPQGKVDVTGSEAARSTLGFGEGSFVAVPIPFNDPTFGAGLALGGGYLFKQDPGSATSFLGLGAFRTENGSLGYGAAFDLSLGNGRWNASLFAGAVDINYDLYVLGVPVPIGQEGAAVNGEFRYGFNPKLSAGIAFRYLDTSITSLFDRTLPSQITDDLTVELATLGVVGRWDDTDSTYYPTRGTRLTFEALQNETLSGRARSYQKAVIQASGYFPLGDRFVVAGDLVGCRSGSEAPFYDSCLLGGTDNFRGYPVMEYFGDQLTSAQLELRALLAGRFGAVVFGGVGEVSDGRIANTDGTVSAAGVGLRFRVSKEFGLDMSLDVSVNQDDEQLVYLYVGQRF